MGIKSLGWPVVLSASICASLLGGGFWFYRSQREYVRQKVEESLETIAQLKVDRIVQWRQDRLGEGALISESPFLQDVVARRIAAARAEDTSDLVTQFRLLQKHYGYFDVLLVDARGNIRLNLSGRRGVLHDEALHALAVAGRERQTVLSDLHAGPGDLPPHAEVVAPFFSGNGALLGAIVLQTDAQHFLYPLIQSWPTPSDSAETLLVRRDGDSVLYLNDLRHRKGAALTLRIPLSRIDVPAVMAVLGKEGFVRGIDYRGVEVVSVLKAIPDSPWFVVSKMDTAEAFVGWRFRSALILAVVVALFAGVSISVALIWQNMEKEHFQALYESEAAFRMSEERFQATFEQAAVGIAHVAPDGRFLHVNRRLCEITGYSREELLQKTFQDITHPDDLDASEANSERVLAGQVQSYSTEKRYLRKNGSIVWITITVSVVRGPSGTPKYSISVVEDISERKRAEVQLRSSEGRYRSLVNATSQMVWITDSRGQATGPIPTWQQYTGQSDEEVMGSGWAKALHPDDVEATLKVWARALETGTRYVVEYRVRRHDGVYRDFLVNGVPVPAEDGSIREWVGTCLDVTEHKLADSRILHLNQLLRAIRDVNSLAVKERNPQRLLGEACKALMHARGYLLVWVGLAVPGSDCVISAARAGQEEHYINEIGNPWDEGPAGQGPVGMAIRNREARVINDVATDTSLGPWRDAASAHGCRSMAVFPMVQGLRVYGALLVCADHPGAFDHEEIGLLNDLAADLALALQSIEDENKRRKAEEDLVAQTRALVESELRYRELFENANDIIYTIDLSGNFTSLNKAGERISGFTRAEALRMNFHQVLAPECLAETQENMRRVIAGQTLAPSEYVIIGKHGRRITLEVSIRTIMQEDKPVGIEGIARDVSERNLLQKQLLQAQKMEAIGRLAGGIAHDFNNLLTIIIGCSDFLLTGIPPGSPAHADAGRIKSAGTRAAGLTSKLLAFSRTQILQPRAVDLNILVEESTKLLQRLLGEDIELITTLSPHLSCVKVDVTQMEQVIMNLAVNARDAMPKGGKLTLQSANIELDQAFVSSHPGSRAGRFVMLATSDTGIGMDAETKLHVFEPFFTTKEEGKGTGLGLATVYGIVKQSNGYIAVESEPGCGATFTIYLPRVDEAAEKIQSVQASGSRGSETILVVEDTDEVRALACRFLQAKGYNLLEAKDAAEAMKIASEYIGKIHLLATDLILPGGMNGGDLAARFQSSHPGIKVLYISGYAGATAANDFSDPGIAFLRKPYTGEDLASKVREVLQKDAPKYPRNG